MYIPSNSGILELCREASLRKTLRLFVRATLHSSGRFLRLGYHAAGTPDAVGQTGPLRGVQFRPLSRPQTTHRLRAKTPSPGAGQGVQPAFIEKIDKRRG